jgi:hypothetical protein
LREEIVLSLVIGCGRWDIFFLFGILTGHRGALRRRKDPGRVLTGRDCGHVGSWGGAVLVFSSILTVERLVTS